MSKSVLSRPQVQGSVGRSAADLSCVRNFHQSAGMIVPIWSHAFIAGSDGYIDRRSFCRTTTPVFAPFQQVTQHVDIVMVPIRYLFTPWNDWKLNVDDINSSLLQSDSAGSSPGFMNQAPRMDFGTELYKEFPNVYSTVQESVRQINNFCRLCEGLEYSSKVLGKLTAFQETLFMLAAYQKAYYDIYRNTAYESNQPLHYNLDWMWKNNNGLFDRTKLTSSGGVTTREQHAFKGLTSLRFVNYRNDYFHNIYPSLNYVVSIPVGSWNLPSNLVGSSVVSVNNYNNPIISRTLAVQSVSPGAVSGYSGTNDLVINAQQIRAIFALDKLMRASAYAPKHVKDQFKARFDVDVPESVGMESVRIASWQNDVTFGEVTSTSDTESSGGSPLGAIGGKGVGAAKDNRVHFHCKEDSIILALQYFMPLAMYDGDGCSDWNIKFDREDFFQPEFQNLGLRPLYRKLFNAESVSANDIVGYTVPNQYYKLGINKNLGLFSKTYYAAQEISGAVSFGSNISPLRAFTIHTQPPFGTNSVANSDYFKVHPEDLDYIFAQSYDTTNNDPATDQFFGQVRIGCQLTHNMTVHGQPSL